MERSTKSSWRALRRDGGHGALRLCANTWIAEMNEAAVGLAVEARRKKETFQVGWRMLLQLMEGRRNEETFQVG